MTTVRPSKMQGVATPKKTMRAAVITGPRTVEIANCPLPIPSDHQVRVRLQGCGVCASNVPVWEGRPWFEYPREAGSPGHEGWGIVDAVGKAVTAVREGDPVACLTYNAFAEFDLADESAVVPLPASLHATPFPGEPLGCAVNVFRRSQIHPGEHVVVVGVGFLGALLIQLLKATGAQVLAVSRRASSLELAKQCGAASAIPLADSGQVSEAAASTVGQTQFPCVIETTGKQVGIDIGTELTGERGRLVIAGYHQDGSRQVNMQQWNWRGIDVINAHERDPAVYIEGMRQAVQEVEAGVIDLSPLLTHHFQFADLGAALELASERPVGFTKAYVTIA